jgi:predicted flap endonuclease-1-like 5' DNA nuclease
MLLPGGPLPGSNIGGWRTGEEESMSGSTLQIASYLLATVAFGVVIGWLIRSPHSKRHLDQLTDELQLKVDDVIRQRDRFTAENTSLRSSIEAQQSVVHRHETAATKGRTELESAHEKTKSLSKDLFGLRAERDELNIKVNNSQNQLNLAQQQTAELQTEFVKAGKFYKGELEKAFDRRKKLENKINNAKLEHESLGNLLKASRSEHESVKKMLDSARIRLGNLDVLEQNVIELEADNALLRHDAARTKQQIDALQRDVAELDELRIQNRELAHCLKSMENSRRQYEDDAKRYRDHAGQSEQQSETLQLKLNDLEKQFVDMAKQEHKALEDARKKKVAKESNGQIPEQHEVDDLTEIIGIGKVFEKTLHDLGIFSFRQIATFDVADISRVNMELNEFKGRMEQDDWIGQAKELHFGKYDGSGKH